MKIRKKENNNICAVILTGGKSSRMGGGIKTFKKFNNRIIFDRIFQNIKSQVEKIIINSNDSENLFLKYNVVVVKDTIKGFAGPLAGIHAALNWIFLNEKNINWIITIPSDTPFIPKNLVNELIKKTSKGKLKIILAKSKGKIHPVIGAWHTSLYNSLNNDLNAGTRKILDWASKHPLGYVNFFNSKYDPFFNINYIKDLAKAEEIEKLISE